MIDLIKKHKSSIIFIIAMSILFLLFLILPFNYSFLILGVGIFISLSYLAFFIYQSSKYGMMNLFFEHIILSLLISNIIMIIFLTLLFVFELIPIYFSSIYILLGSILVFSINLYFNKKIENEKEQRKKFRLLAIIDDSIETNFTFSKYFLKELKKDPLFSDFSQLNYGFWDFKNQLIDIDYNPLLIESLILIREVISMFNTLVIERKKILSGIPNDLNINDYFDNHINEKDKLFLNNKNLKKVLKRIIKESELFLNNKTLRNY